MKNKLTAMFVSLIFLALVLGCSSINPFAGKTDSSKSSDSTTDSGLESVIVEKTGVPECDELSAYVSKLMSSKDEGYVAKATREFILNRYREGIKKSLEENKDNPEKLAKYCKEYKTQLESYKKDEDEKKEAQ